MAEKWTKTSSPLWRWMKPKPLLALNHFTVPCSLLTAYSFPSAGNRLSTTLSYLMPKFRAPQQSRGRLQASFWVTAKRSTEQKNGRKCDLATALLPKGDTRATNAKTEYHGMEANARGLWRCVVAFKGMGVTAGKRSRVESERRNQQAEQVPHRVGAGRWILSRESCL